ncbi:MAG: ATP-binding protein [Leptolyngbya sp. SIO4C1]|nr:ATP-binding protein [Leptolyngbya sp. SIO4C1]
MIAGKNNVGKTAFLEAIGLLFSGSHPNGIAYITNLRGLASETADTLQSELIFNSLFNTSSQEQDITVKAMIDSRQHCLTIRPSTVESTTIDLPSDQENALAFSKSQQYIALNLSYKPPEQDASVNTLRIQANKLTQTLKKTTSPSANLSFVSSQFRLNRRQKAEMLGEIELSGEKSSLIKDLQIIEPRLSQITTIVIGGMPILYGNIGLDKMIPIAAMGEGLNKLVSILLTLSAKCRDGILLVDEIENGFHHSVLQNIWRIIDSASRRFNTQAIV